MDDADILARLRSREYRAALELLLPRYRDHVYRLAISLLRNRAAAEDATQDVMLRLWRALPAYDARAALGTWIYAITRNTCLSELRKRRPQVPWHAIAERAEGLDGEAPVSESLLAAPERDDSAVASVQQLLAQLPERQAQAVTLFYLEDKSYEQTAQALDMPLGTLKAILHRARRRLVELAEERR
jgi:RNA polymerase sigma-70 factor (ECF subfamily)